MSAGEPTLLDVPPDPEPDTAPSAPPAKMTAADVKDALRRRHPALDSYGIVSEWTCLEEWQDIDLLAISAWTKATNVGYEVKVSRSDYRRELLKPSKRSLAVAGCHEFYFAVPEGLLKPAELAYKEPEWEPGDFNRTPCPGIPPFGPRLGRQRDDDLRRYGGRCSDWHTKAIRGFTVEVPAMTSTDRWRGDYVSCPTCGGKGYLERSRVEREAPTLWVPRDVGLIEITARGCRVTRKAPKRKPEKPLVPPEMVQIVRWASVRPDPRHVAARQRLEREPRIPPERAALADLERTPKRRRPPLELGGLRVAGGSGPACSAAGRIELSRGRTSCQPSSPAALRD